MSKYVNIYSEFVKNVAERFNIPYENALKKIETSKPLQAEWRDIKSHQTQLFVPVRTITRASALHTGMAEDLPYAPPPNPQIENEAANLRLAQIEAQQAADHQVAINRQTIRHQRDNDRTELRRARLLGGDNVVVDDMGDVWMNMFGEQEQEPAQQPVQLPIKELTKLQAAIRGKLERTEAKNLGRLTQLLEGLPQGKFHPSPKTLNILNDPEERERMNVIVELSKQLQTYPKRDQAAAKQMLLDNLPADKQALIGYKPSPAIAGIGLIGDMGKMLEHLTSHIADPNEPIDPRDYSQALMLIKDIQKQKSKSKSKGGSIIDWEDIKWGTFSKQFEAFKHQHPSNTIKDLEDFAKHILSHPKHFKPTTKKRANFYLNVLNK